MTRRWSS